MIIEAFSDPWKAGDKFKKEVLCSKKKSKYFLLKFLRSSRARIDSIDLDGKTIMLDDVTEEQAKQWWQKWFGASEV